jgi:hypothetical protein
MELWVGGRRGVQRGGLGVVGWRKERVQRGGPGVREVGAGVIMGIINSINMFWGSSIGKCRDMKCYVQ